MQHNHPLRQHLLHSLRALEDNKTKVLKFKKKHKQHIIMHFSTKACINGKQHKFITTTDVKITSNVA